MQTPETLKLNPETAAALLREYGSPLYVYSEDILRRRCREMVNLVQNAVFQPNYSAKANTNMELLKIIKSEGLSVDAMSPGEILLEQTAGFAPEDILFISNDVDEAEMVMADELGVLVSVDSLSQLETFGRALPGRRVAVRLNPGIGAGHHEKVVTGGRSKFGIQLEEIPAIKAVAAKYGLTIAGVNHHIGSLFLQSGEYLAACKTLLCAALAFDALEFVDLGGGMGVPYQRSEPRLDLGELARGLETLIREYYAAAGRSDIKIKVEPGRYIVAECGLLLGTVHSIKENYGETYVGTDVGFNVLMRPVLYDSYHEIHVYNDETEEKTVTVVGNICESGDILARNRSLPKMHEGDIIGVENAGAYGYVMASNYNSRLRPAEVLACQDGSFRMIRRRDTYEDLLRQL